MKLTKILLRWYKSFHLNYRGISEKGETTAYRPWNKLSPPYASGEEFPFIEIPIEADITTIVGANESGKSHLLNAVTKVVRGSGIDGLDQFECTDLCHYAGVRTRNVEAWPNIGLQFSIESKAEFEQINAVIGDTLGGGVETHRSFAVVLAPDQDAHRPAQVFVEPNDQGIPLDLASLNSLRAKRTVSAQRAPTDSLRESVCRRSRVRSEISGRVVRDCQMGSSGLLATIDQMKTSRLTSTHRTTR